MGRGCRSTQADAARAKRAPALLDLGRIQLSLGRKSEAEETFRRLSAGILAAKELHGHRLYLVYLS